MSRSSVYGLVTAISSILLITLGLGQACSPNGGSLFGSGFGAAGAVSKVPGASVFVGASSNGNGGGYSGMESNGNGGGYSGLQSIAQGEYGGGFSMSVSHPHWGELHGGNPNAYRSGTSILQNADDLYLHVEAHASCMMYQTGWKMAGPNINGIIATSSEDDGDVSAYYLASACVAPVASSSKLLPSDVTYLDFDPTVAIYQNRIFQAAPAAPPDVSSLMPAVAYCVGPITTAPSGLQTGLAVEVYRNGQQLMGVINYGAPNTSGDGAIRFAVPPFTVDQATSMNQITYSTSGFELGVTTSGSLPSQGSLMVNLDGKKVSLSMKCWF